MEGANGRRLDLNRMKHRQVLRYVNVIEEIDQVERGQLDSIVNPNWVANAFKSKSFSAELYVCRRLRACFAASTSGG
jgi:hypothetical protein